MHSQISSWNYVYVHKQIKTNTIKTFDLPNCYRMTTICRLFMDHFKCKKM
jgi:hypothetical protein